MKRFFKRKGFIITTAITLVLSITVGCMCIFGQELEEVYVPENASLTSTTITRPTTGNPSDYSAKDNLYIAQGVTKSSSFSTHSEGATKASIVSQDIYAERIVTPTSCYKKSISYSKFVKVGTEIYISGDDYLIREAKKVNSINSYEFVNDDKYLTKLSADDFYSYYGNTPNGLSGYIINDSTILSATAIGFDTDGNYEFEYELDPTLSSIAIRNEMKTMAGVEKYPIITSVTFKLWLNSNWDVVKTESHAEYKVEMKGLGVVPCEEHTTEYFTFEEIESLPNEDYFNSKVDSTDIGDSIILAPSATDILLDAFAPYMEGDALLLDFEIKEKELSGQAKIILDTESIENTIVEVVLDNTDIYLKYAENKVFISTNGINGFIDIDEYSELLNELVYELGIDFGELESFDLTSLLDCIELNETDDYLEVDLNCEMLNTKIDASLQIENGSKSISANIILNDSIELSLSSSDKTKIKDTSNLTFYSFAPLINSLLSNKIYLSSTNDEFSFDILINLASLEIIGNGEIFNKNINFEIDTSSFKAEINGILTETTKFEEMLGLGLASTIAPTSINDLTINFSEILANSTIEITDANDIIVTIPVLGIDISVAIEARGNGYTLDSINLNTDALNYNIKVLDYIVIERIDKSKTAISLNKLIDELVSLDFSYSTYIANTEIKLDANIIEKEIYIGIPEFEVDAWLNERGLYFTKGDFNGYVDIENSNEILTLAKLLLGDDISIDQLSSIQLPSFRDLLANLHLTQTESSLILSIPISAGSIKLELPIINNSLSLSSINLTLGEHTIALTKIDSEEKQLITSNYKNIKPIFDLILDGKLTFETIIDGHTLVATIDLNNFDINAILDGQLKMLVSGGTLYANYNDLFFKFDLDSLNELLPKISKDLGLQLPSLDSFEFDSLTNALKSLTAYEMNDVTTLSLSLEPISLLVNLATYGNEYHLDSIKINLDGFNLQLTPSTNHFNSNINIEKTSFIDANDVIDTYYDSLINIINTNYLSIDAYGTITTEANESEYSKINYTLDLAFPIASSETKIKAVLGLEVNEIVNGEVSKTTKYDIEINFQNDRVYFSFNGIKGTFNTDEIERSKSSIAKLFESIPELNDLMNSLSEMTNLNLDISSWDLYSIIKDITYDKDKNLGLILNLSFLSSSLPSNLELQISKSTSNALTISTIKDTNFQGIDIGVNATIAPLQESVEECTFEIIESDSYIVFDSVNNLLETLANTVSLRHFHVTADITIQLVVTINISLDLKVDIDENGVATIMAILNNKNSSSLGSSIAFNNDEFTTTLYTRTDMDTIYYSKNYIYDETVWEGTFIKLPKTYTRNVTDYGTFTNADFNAHSMDIIFYLLDLSETITSQFSSSEGSSDASVEEVFQSYDYNESENTYTIGLNLSSLDSMLGDTTIEIVHTSPDSGEIELDQLNATIRLMNTCDLELNASLVDHNNVDYGTKEMMDNFVSSYTSSFVPMY